MASDNPSKEAAFDWFGPAPMPSFTGGQVVLEAAKPATPFVPAYAPQDFSDRAYHLPTDSNARKDVPMAAGLLDYFPDALADVARLSKIGNDKHNPGQPLHWSRGKSDDHADCIMRHLVDRGTIDTDSVLHDTKVAWRALAQLQLAIERLRAAGVSY